MHEFPELTGEDCTSQIQFKPKPCIHALGCGVFKPFGKRVRFLDDVAAANGSTSKATVVRRVRQEVCCNKAVRQ